MKCEHADEKQRDRKFAATGKNGCCGAADDVNRPAFTLKLFDGGEAGAITGAAQTSQSADAARERSTVRGSGNKPESGYQAKNTACHKMGRGNRDGAAGRAGAQTAEDETDAKADGGGWRESFDKLIKGEYKEAFNERVQKIIDKRFAQSKSLEDRFARLEPALQRLYEQYGVDPGDDGALSNAIDKDIRNDQELKKAAEESRQRAQRNYAQWHRRMEEVQRNHKAAAQKQAEARANSAYAGWMRQGDEAKKAYPGFDMAAESKNEMFIRLLRADVPVKTAYEMVHSEEILGGAMAYTASQVSKKIATNIMARGTRPSENGLSKRSAVITKPDVAKLSKHQREEISRRVLRGEKISF